MSTFTDSLFHTRVAMLKVRLELFISPASRQGASKNAARNFTKLTNLTLKSLYTKFATMLDIALNHIPFQILIFIK